MLNSQTGTHVLRENRLDTNNDCNLQLKDSLNKNKQMNELLESLSTSNIKYAKNKISCKTVTNKKMLDYH